MDKTTQEKVRDNRPWSYDGSVICKKCNKMHSFREFGDTVADINYFFEFPNGDVSLVRIPCLEDPEGTLYDYRYEEVLMPVSLKSDSKLKEIETRVERLEDMVGKGDLGKDEKSVRDRLTGLEEVSTKIAETVLAGKPNQPPKGQHT